MMYIMYNVVQETTGKVIQSRPYDPAGWAQASQFALIMAQAGVGPIRLEKQTSTFEFHLIVRLTGAEGE